MPALGDLCECFHTQFISTSPKGKFPGAVHMQFNEENALSIAKDIVGSAVDNYANRVPDKIFIPEEKTACMVGFSARPSSRPWEAPWIPCSMPSSPRHQGHCRGGGMQQSQDQTRPGACGPGERMIKNNVLVVTTGCNAIACAKVGLMLPEAAVEAGDGLKGVCQGAGACRRCCTWVPAWTSAAS